MQLRNRLSSWGARAALVISISAPTSAGALTLQSWVATARIMSGNSTLVSAPSPAAPSAPDDTTGFLEANGSNLTPPGPIDAGAVATFGLSSGILAGGSSFNGAANAPIDNRNFGISSGASTTYFDDLTITSSTLANGTAVDVRFVFDLAFAAGAAVSAGDVNESNYASAAANIQVTVDGTTQLAGANNRYLENLDTGSFIQNGIFSGSQHAEFTISSFVGSTFQFAAVVDVDADGAVRLNGGVNGAADAASFVALAYGAEVVGADAAVASALLGSDFPAAALVSPAAAQNALASNPLAVPEPALAGLILPVLAALGRAARAR